ncbi:hypothetical protein OESDEN_08932 [Oesophagostomum dentatum]|uniref:Uncharacterized protein n=1 Tax=Oesophagostomum dentatum TaxID=61180 RepID=A0A0B1T106_OESDE|nr:hypothetical protein OESDEN_08932 [Oesophagostomum dentatum]
MAVFSVILLLALSVVLSTSDESEPEIVLVQAYTNGANFTVQLQLYMYKNERVSEIYDRLTQTYKKDFYCLTYKGFYLHSAYALGDFKLSGSVRMKIEEDEAKCVTKLGPKAYFRVLSMTTTKPSTPPANIDTSPNRRFVKIVLWTAGGTISVVVILSCLYYIKVSIRAKEIKSEFKSVKESAN